LTRKGGRSLGFLSFPEKVTLWTTFIDSYGMDGKKTLSVSRTSAINKKMLTIVPIPILPASMSGLEPVTIGR
jgi:hypothetical protein